MQNGGQVFGLSAVCVCVKKGKKIAPPGESAGAPARGQRDERANVAGSNSFYRRKRGKCIYKNESPEFGSEYTKNLGIPRFFKGASISYTKDGCGGRI